MLGVTLIFSGRPKEGVKAVERSIRLDPRDPHSAVRLSQLTAAFYLSGDYAAAVEVAKRAIRSYPDFANPYRWLAAALGQLDQIEAANRVLQQAIAISNVGRRNPWHRREDYAHFVEGLRKAGWRET
jgi:adenylate cyclase